MLPEKRNQLVVSNITSSAVIATRAQQEMFLIEQTAPELNCVIHYYREIEGELDPERLSGAVETLITQLPLLQTRFACIDGVLWQIYDQRISEKLLICDLRHTPQPQLAATERIQQSIDSARKKEITSANTLYQFTLYRIADCKFILSIWFHHILVDGRSLALIESLLIKEYNNTLHFEKTNSTSKYFAFDANAKSDHEYQSSSEKIKDEQFWAAYVQDLKRDAISWRSIISNQKREISQYRNTLSHSQREKINHIGRSYAVSEQRVLLSAAILLIRILIDKPCFSVSLPVPGIDRNAAPGMTSNVLPLRVNLPATMTLAEVIQSVSGEVKNILQHQRYRGEDILRLAELKQHSSFGPIINVMIFDRGEGFERCHSVSHRSANRDDLQLQITFWGTKHGGNIDIILEADNQGHSATQLAHLSQQLQSIIDSLNHQQQKCVADIIDQCQLANHPVLRNSLYLQQRQPPAAGFLQWQLPAEQLVRQVYASGWRGSEPLAYSLPKMLLAQCVILVGQLTSRPTPVMEAVTGTTAGTLLAIEEQGWLVATGQGTVYLSGLQNQTGNPLSANALAASCGLQIGSQLPLITATQAEQLSTGRQAVLEQQSYWQRHFTAPVLAQLSAYPIQNQNTAPCWHQSPSYNPSDRLPGSPPTNAFELLTAWFIYLARDHHNRGECFQIGCLQEPTGSTELEDRLFTRLRPFEISIDISRNFAEIVEQVRHSYQQWLEQVPCLAETVTRQILAGQQWLAKRHPWPLAVAMLEQTAADKTAPAQAHAELLTLQIDRHTASFRWIYDAQRITAPQVARISEHLINLLSAAKRHSTAALSVADFALLTSAERQQLQLWGNLAHRTPAPSTTLAALFSARLAQHQDAVALQYGDQTLSYRELNQRANCLAHALIARGVCPEQRVALCAVRSMELIIGLLAILKAGGAYLPLDPAYPGERLRYILKDAEPCLLLADETGQKVLGEHEIPTLALASVTSYFEPAYRDSPQVPELTPSSLAYLIYTSGSTGQPKGVMVEQRQIANFIQAMGELQLTSITQSIHILMNFSIMFDASWCELAALFYGGKLIMTPQEDKYDPAKIVTHVATRKVNVLCCTPSQLEGLLLAGLEQQITSNALLLLGGEALPSELWQRLQQMKQIKAVNAYGPTETSVVVTCAHITAQGSKQPVIGGSFAAARLYLLDSQLQQVPAGAVGEIYIGGIGVARGYFKRADLTEQRFLPDPFSDQPAARMYRSGDLGCWQSDGQLAYLGRNDEQVKIRGFRIELGEIATQLNQHPSISEAVVIARGEANALQLVAYLILHPGQTTDATALREHLAQRLPSYMLPSAYVPISALPLTPNGKLDKRALPEPNQQAFARATYLAPEGEIECGLAAIWCQLLGIERVSRHDNFFTLGGHSLLVVKMCDMIGKQLAKNVLVATVFASSDLAALAASLEGRAEETDDTDQKMACDKTLPPMNFISANKVPFEQVLLTGAAGFLGIYLLAEIQRQYPRAKVHCLVRGKQGLQRLRQAAQRYRLTLDETRLIVIAGDLSAARLGTSREQWQRLAQQIDAIYHCGAWVNHLHSYSTLRDSNVQSTSELLALCCQGRAKQMFYISTLSTAPQQGNRLREDVLAASSPLRNSYVRTKWVCEHLMMQAFSAGLHGAIYRMGNITGSTQHGASNVESNHMLSIMKGCLQLGVAPDWQANRLDISPVDIVASLVISAGRKARYLNRALNLGYLSTLSWQHLFQYLVQKGHQMQFVAPEIWSSEWVPQVDSDNALYPFKVFYLSADEKGSRRTVDVVEKVLVDAEAEHFEATALLETYYHYWRQSGFLPAPER
ncbi:non-ribosomal peptide synthetase [Serratia microhaemolytica]|uniref:non-ribosomal peptide synthetase n=1 Tax=Serratia microhaemolytica TaxID=2675110 RepID=UPI000FDDFC39|nr:non-ribosomal peptide synthetase [Serratia microhaemolytica]